MKDNKIIVVTSGMGAHIEFSNPDLYPTNDTPPDLMVSIKGQYMEASDLREAAEAFLVMARKMEAEKAKVYGS